ncbi:MAG: hypothetical protein AB7I37_13905 [Pirellulales bacterium]
MKALPLGTLVISVDVERGCDRQDRQESSLANRVLATLARAELPSTIGLTQPGCNRHTDGLLAEFPTAELALLAEESWAGQAARRRQFAAGLSRNVLRAAAAGYAIRTLVFPGDVQQAHSDLLIKHGISVLRGEPRVAVQPRLKSILRRFSGEASSLLVEPRNIRYGLWEVPCAASLPGTPGSVLRAWIDRAAETRGILHLRIDVPGLLRDTRGGLVELGRVVEQAASRRDQHRLRIATLCELADRAQPRRIAAPAQSILRVRAA